MVVVLAGDIGVADKPKTIGPFVHEMARRHRAVIHVSGNHEHWGSSYLRTYDKIRSAIGMYPEYDLIGPKVVGIPSNVFTLEREVVILDDVAFLGATLWTDFRNGNPIALMNARNGMRDYDSIRFGPVGNPYLRKLKPHDVFLIHRATREWLFERIKAHKDDGRKVFVITHHAPSEQSLIYDPNNMYNPCYATELGYQIADLKPDVWVHGHIHANQDYKIGDTRIVCNPRGYLGVEMNDDFNPELVIEV